MPGKLAAPSCRRPRRQRRERSHRHRRCRRRHHHRSQARRAERHGRSACSAENSPPAMGHRGRAVRAAEHDRTQEDRWRKRSHGRLRHRTARFLGPAPLPAGVYKDIPLNDRVVLAW